MTLLVGRHEGHLACEKWDAGLLEVTIWLELCTSVYSSSCPTPPPSSLATTKSIMETLWYWLTQVHLEKWPLKRREYAWKTAVKSVCVVSVNVVGARRARGCFRAARGARTWTSVRRMRRCATMARVETWRRVTRATVRRGTLVRRAASDATRSLSSSAKRHNLPSASAHLSF